MGKSAFLPRILRKKSRLRTSRFRELDCCLLAGGDLLLRLEKSLAALIIDINFFIDEVYYPSLFTDGSISFALLQYACCGAQDGNYLSANLERFLVYVIRSRATGNGLAKKFDKIT